MSSWTKQMGYPLVSVERTKNADGKCVLQLTQKRFITDGGGDELGSIWQVPIGIISEAHTNSDSPQFKKLLIKKEDRFELDGVKDGEWVKVSF